MSKFTELFDSLTWNATLSLVSLAILANYLVSMIAARSHLTRIADGKKSVTVAEY